MDRIPSDLLAAKQRTIADLKPAETGWALVITGLVVAEDGRCWLKLNSELQPSGGTVMDFEVRRESDKFHIVIPRQVYRTTTNSPTYEPVVSVTFRESSDSGLV